MGLAQHAGFFVLFVAAQLVVLGLFALSAALLARPAVWHSWLAKHAASAVGSVLAAPAQSVECAAPAGGHAEPAGQGLQSELAVLGLHAEPAAPAWWGLLSEPAALGLHAEHALVTRGESVPALHLGPLPVYARQVAHVAAAESCAEHDLPAAATTGV